MDIIRIVISLIILKLLWIGIKPWIATLYINKFIPTGDIKHLETAIRIHPYTENMYNLAGIYNNQKNFFGAANLSSKMLNSLEGGIHKGAVLNQAAVIHANMGSLKYAVHLAKQAQRQIPFPNRSIYRAAQQVIDLIEGQKHEHC